MKDDDPNYNKICWYIVIEVWRKLQHLSTSRNFSKPPINISILRWAAKSITVTLPKYWMLLFTLSAMLASMTAVYLSHLLHSKLIVPQPVKHKLYTTVYQCLQCEASQYIMEWCTQSPTLPVSSICGLPAATSCSNHLIGSWCLAWLIELRFYTSFDTKSLILELFRVEWDAKQP